VAHLDLRVGIQRDELLVETPVVKVQYFLDAAEILFAPKTHESRH
jgi:hypothetical protein